MKKPFCISGIDKHHSKNKDTAYVNGLNRKAVADNANRPKQNDKGLTGAKPWYDPKYIPKGWHTINIPGYWEDRVSGILMALFGTGEK
ncbi:MAG: hypothetical protein WDO16_03040 [Bacteroidota bacterium]